MTVNEKFQATIANADMSALHMLKDILDLFHANVQDMESFHRILEQITDARSEAEYEASLKGATQLLQKKTA